MESSEEPTSLQSICHLHASELFPKHTHPECEDETLTVPFTPLSGESIVALGRTTDGVLALSNYRLYLQLSQTCHIIPLGLIEQLEVREIFYLHIGCKDARSLSCAFSTNEHCFEWFKRLHKLTYSRKSIEDIFAFAYYAWSIEEGTDFSKIGKDNGSFVTTFNAEVERLKFNLHGTWRISQINKDYRMCPSYPPLLLVPSCINDATLELVAKYRSSSRIPAVVWRHVNNGAVIARSSQPELGWFGWREPCDENLLKALSDACSYDKGESTMVDSFTDACVDATAIASNTKKVLIVDARSYTTAVANRARGGGCECREYYPNCDIQFMNLPNIHSIRKSFHAVRQLYATDADQPTWLSLLEGTRWLQHMSGLLRAAVTVATAIERDARPVLVHCSDGWDRTPQIVALAQILLDPYYRTMEGFQILCEREWLDFGHKFADRCGQTVGCDDPNERCPVFLQWLDCVHQLTVQFKSSFQMSSAYLVKLAQHTYSQLFGTFLCNTIQERLQLRIRERTFSVWRFLNSSSFVNHLYSPLEKQVLWPNCNVRELVLWPEVYSGSMESSVGMRDDKQNVAMIDIERGENEEPQGQMTKTRSYGDLMHAPDHTAYLHRRLSDPSISVEKKLDSLTLEAVETMERGANHADDCKVTVCMQNNRSEADKDEDLDKDLDKPNRHNAATTEPSNDSPANPSVDSSTDTLIPSNDSLLDATTPDKPISQESSPQDIVSSWVETNSIGQTVCSCTRNYNPNHSQNHNEGRDLSDTSAPLISRTPSSSVCPASPIHRDTIPDNLDRLDDIDGLPIIRCDVQMRVQQIIAEHKLKEEALRKELHTTRLALIKQVCNHNTTDTDRIDDIGSLPDSVGSAGDHGESLPSDMSWEAVEELGPAPTLWVPDHAVTRCMGCNTEFWLGRRKHHCRCCGKIFCADCSENSTPLPSEQLYNPVRVCSDCFSRIHRHTSPCQCNARHASKGENDAELPTNSENLVACPRSKGLNMTKDSCCDNLLQVTHQKSQPPVTAATVN
ncbi:phosphatidylinositol-3,5-bisphosphate 3-phosphatase MTMR4 isoform X2 [Nomia melanderi]|uniref:phosphatidylinositol-3,5-bisphosphate 3-phosphatase MTMR4 isoform X2 n=1 Tax=Nomia melanderi TaxID=2448451 RepID=UPI00130434D1|nr:myotubularin-related protein 3 isoform X2 [Nomia melanderi]XP_031830269.1 myotubularin-related protein 3 isoform X2 [Nomia melanderi]